MNGITSQTLNLLSQVSKGRDLTHDLQTEIHPELFFRRNSVNLLIGKKGSGKTYNVFREVLKLKFIPNHHYTKMIYITNKVWDRTYDLFKEILPIPLIRVNYDGAVKAIREVSEAKNAAHEIVSKGIDLNDIEDESKQHLNDILGAELTTNNDVYHTIVLLDDCLDRFAHRTPQNAELWRLLFENRDPKITYFLTMQDAKGIDSALKENCDSIWLFGSFTPNRFRYLMRFIPTDSTTAELFPIYYSLTKNQALIFDIKPDGTEMIILKR